MSQRHKCKIKTFSGIKRCGRLVIYVQNVERKKNVIELQQLLSSTIGQLLKPGVNAQPREREPDEDTWTEPERSR